MFNEAMDLGAQGYLLKESAVSEIVEAIKRVAAGQAYISATITAYLLKRSRRPAGDRRREHRHSQVNCEVKVMAEGLALERPAFFAAGPVGAFLN